MQMSEQEEKRLFLLKFQDGVGVSTGQDAPHKIKVTDVDAAVRTTH